MGRSSSSGSLESSVLGSTASTKLDVGGDVGRRGSSIDTREKDMLQDRDHEGVGLSY
jgi:hypothetical protein